MPCAPHRSENNYKTAVVSTTVSSHASLEGLHSIICCPHCGNKNKHDLVQGSGRKECTSRSEFGCPGYNLKFAIGACNTCTEVPLSPVCHAECSTCGSVQEPGLQSSCITCTEPHGQWVASLCSPLAQAQAAALLRQARSHLAKELQATKSVKTKGIKKTKEIAKARLQATKEKRHMLAGAVSDRGNGEEVLIAISELIAPPTAWPECLAKAFWSRRWDNPRGRQLVRFLAHNGLPQLLMWQWIAFRGVACDYCEVHNLYSQTPQGEVADGNAQAASSD